MQFVVKQFGGTFMNLDSKLPEPVPFADFVVFANDLLSKGNQMILVVDPADRDSLWRTEQEE